MAQIKSPPFEAQEMCPVCGERYTFVFNHPKYVRVYCDPSCAELGRAALKIEDHLKTLNVDFESLVRGIRRRRDEAYRIGGRFSS